MSNASWLDGLGEWSWPGLRPAVAVDAAPAAWVPTLPTIDPPAVSVTRPRSRPSSLPRPLRLARLVALVAVGAATFTISSDLLRRQPAVAGEAARVRFAATFAIPFERSAPSPVADARYPSLSRLGPPLPQPATVSSDRAGSTIVSLSYDSAALGWRDRFIAYLPPGYRSHAGRRYPVLYLLHGYEQPASSFLRLGVQSTLDRLIATRAIAPLIAVMPQGAPAPQDWLNTSGPRYFSYVGEVQRIVDRVLRTIPARGARGIAGYSMGGYGAMNVALRSLRRYSVVESWEGDFTGLASELAADRRLLRTLPLHAFVWGASGDIVVGSSSDAPWAAAMRADGAQAQSAVYPGKHAFGPIEAHLAAMLTFAGRSLRS